MIILVQSPLLDHKDAAGGRRCVPEVRRRWDAQQGPLGWLGSKSKVEVFPTLAATAPDWIVERYPQGAVTPDSTTVLQYHVHHNDIVSFFHHLRDTFKVFSVLEPGDLDNWARTLSLPIASKSHLTFSNLELTQDHVLKANMLWFFNHRHKCP